MYAYPIAKHEHGECVNIGACKDLYSCMAAYAGPQVHILSDSNCTCANPANLNTSSKMASLSSPAMFFRTWVGTFMSLVHVEVASPGNYKLHCKSNVLCPEKPSFIPKAFTFY